MSEKNSIEKENESKVYICENCGKEHDGSYGSGRFCSKSCKCSFNAKKNHWSKSETREWKCECCGLVFPTRRKLKEHQHETNHLLDNKHMVAKLKNPICPFCGEKHETKQGMKLHQRLCEKNPNRDIELVNKLSEIQKISGNKKETKLKHSLSAIKK